MVAEPEAVAGALLERWGGLVDRISFYAPYETDRDTWLPVVDRAAAGLTLPAEPRSSRGGSIGGAGPTASGGSNELTRPG